MSLFSEPTFYFHDYETFGADPKYDRPAQFAGVRTTLDLEEVGEPLDIYCKITPDYIPHPEACLITGITPQKTLEQGLPEYEFARRIFAELSAPQTCGVGYNSLRFDDELTRHVLYRNLFDPYAREWQNQNSRFDLLDVCRLCHLLRPEGIVWPKREDGAPSFKLEHLTAANGIIHTQAHTALADVRATIALAKLIKKAQPRLWDYALKMRDKYYVKSAIDLKNPSPLIHVSDMYKAELGAFTLAFPLGIHPGRINEVLLWDLRHDPAPFLNLSAAELRKQVFTKTAELAEEGLERVPVKTLHTNKIPMFVSDLRYLTPAIQERWALSLEECQNHAQIIKEHPHFISELIKAFDFEYPAQVVDPDVGLYGGAFFKDYDKSLIFKTLSQEVNQWNPLEIPFQDTRLPEMLLRLKARSYPESLNPSEKTHWELFCKNRREQNPIPKTLNLSDFNERLLALKEEHPNSPILESLEEYVRGIVG